MVKGVYTAVISKVICVLLCLAIGQPMLLAGKEAAPEGKASAGPFIDLGVFPLSLVEYLNKRNVRKKVRFYIPKVEEMEFGDFVQKLGKNLIKEEIRDMIDDSDSWYDEFEKENAAEDEYKNWFEQRYSLELKVKLGSSKSFITVKKRF